jgi:hypothetical protein
MSNPTNPFIDQYVPLNLWPAEIAVFGQTVEYWPGGDMSQAVAITGLWKDGASDEDVSPGRYSRLYVRNADLLALPAEGDMVQAADGSEFDVVKVIALPYLFCELTLHETGAVP